MTRSPHTLVVYFTRTGNTERLARLLAADLDADIEALAETGQQGERHGVSGYVASLFDVLRHRPAELAPTLRDPRAYDLVMIGTPVWAGRASTPVSTWLAQNHASLARVAFFCTMGGRGSDTAFAQMQQLTGLVPVATLAVTDRQMRAPGEFALLRPFVVQVEHALISGTTSTEPEPHRG